MGECQGRRHNKKDHAVQTCQLVHAHFTKKAAILKWLDKTSGHSRPYKLNFCHSGSKNLYLQRVIDFCYI